MNMGIGIRNIILGNLITTYIYTYVVCIKPEIIYSSGFFVRKLKTRLPKSRDLKIWPTAYNWQAVKIINNDYWEQLLSNLVV